ncbi:MarR family transcriptional regulator [Nocardioides sp. zg-536]|uniref:MarR family transcriptional regulator n=1 Tax=Nocardioides faecalis TaxID=2803858 RepID=A0A938Y0A8_9ACTN|nr:MarR family transcriptional regulator [Nocardioides faecalis]MBM9459797.1 MarR family transcriptional regulator [Nocardioides faecalis]QVI58307.1 MarR family transcriptional regulator [Nocardioides faecalis]
MPTAAASVRSNVGLASELRFGVMRLRRRLVRERHPDNDLSLSAMAVLFGLNRFGDLTVGALAAREQVRPPSMTRTVTTLAEAGLVERLAHPTDGRQVVVRLTDAGKTLIEADRVRRDRWLSRRLAELSAEDRDVLRRAAPILQRIADSDQPDDHA